MSGEIYIFGSTVRGETYFNSDVDVLAITEHEGSRDCFPENWSVYSKESIRNMFESGRLFSWHLFLESKCIYKEGDISFVERMGEPKKYSDFEEDFDSLSQLLISSLDEIDKGTNSIIFEFGVVYTALRDIAMISSTKLCDCPCFSRYSPYVIPVDFPVEKELYDLMVCSRLASTRGIYFSDQEKVKLASISSCDIRGWLGDLKRVL